MHLQELTEKQDNNTQAKLYTEKIANLAPLSGTARNSGQEQTNRYPQELANNRESKSARNAKENDYPIEVSHARQILQERLTKQRNWMQLLQKS